MLHGFGPARPRAVEDADASRPDHDIHGALETTGPTSSFFFDALLRTAGIPWPWSFTDVDCILFNLPPLPVTTDQPPCAALERLERAASVVWCWITSGFPPSPDSPWAMPPASALHTLVTWLSGGRTKLPVTSRDLGLEVLKLATMAFNNAELRSVLLRHVAPRVDPQLFYLPDEPAPPGPGSEHTCPDFFLLACLAGGIPLPDTLVECTSRLDRLRITYPPAAGRQYQRNAREAMAAVAWARHFHNRPPPRPTFPTQDSNPLPDQALRYLILRAPGASGNPGADTLAAVCTRIARRAHQLDAVDATAGKNATGKRPRAHDNPSAPPGAGSTASAQGPAHASGGPSDIPSSENPDPAATSSSTDARMLRAELELSLHNIKTLTAQRDAVIDSTAALHTATQAAAAQDLVLAGLRSDCARHLSTLAELTDEIRAARQAAAYQTLAVLVSTERTRAAEVALTRADAKVVDINTAWQNDLASGREEIAALQRQLAAPARASNENLVADCTLLRERWLTVSEQLRISQNLTRTQAQTISDLTKEVNDLRPPSPMESLDLDYDPPSDDPDFAVEFQHGGRLPPRHQSDSEGAGSDSDASSSKASHRARKYNPPGQKDSLCP